MHEIIHNRWIWYFLLIITVSIVIYILEWFFTWKKTIDFCCYENSVKIKLINSIILYNQELGIINHTTKFHLEKAGLIPEDLLILGYSQKEIDIIISTK